MAVSIWPIDNPYILPSHLSLSFTWLTCHSCQKCFGVLLQSSEDSLDYRIRQWSWSEDASLFSLNKIYFRASLKLFVLFHAESRERPLGTVKYALAHFSLAHVCISAWKSPLSLLRIYIAKVAIPQVPCKVIMVDMTSGIMQPLKCCRIWARACALPDQCGALCRTNCCCACVLSL